MLQSARARRETYVGAWLPEPLMAEGMPSPDEEPQIDETVSVALMHALERLTPQDREAIIGRVEMGYSYEELAEALGKPTADAARKAARRALVRLAEEMKSGTA